MIPVETIAAPREPAASRRAGPGDQATRADLLHGSLARRASAFLLDLYAISRNSGIDRFQQTVLLRLRQELPFAAAFWGMMRTTAGGPALHSIFADALPGDFVREWETVKQGDELAALVLGRPGVAFGINTAEVNDRAFAALIGGAGIATATSVAVPSPVPKLQTFLSLFRPVGASLFSPEDHCLQEFIMPHVAAAWHANRLQPIERWQADGIEMHDAFAVADNHGKLHSGSEGFIALMRTEWPKWKGEDLPDALRDAIGTGSNGSGGGYTGAALSVDWRTQSDLILVHARRRTTLDRLSPREVEIAARYRDGLSYKEIARHLDCSPYTVRHHLRTIYSKLEIGDKATLIRLLGNAYPSDH